MDCSHIELLVSRMKLDALLPEGKRFPMGGGLALTSNCNLHCVHCYDRCDSARESLNETQWMEIIDQLEQAGVLFVYLTGGEPTLHPAFPRIYRELKERGFLVEVLTNGTCLPEEILSLFEKYPPLELEVSMYGASQETYQRVTGHGKQYLSFCLGIEELKRRGIPFRLKTVLLRENVQDFEAMRDFAEDCDAPFFYAAIPFLRLDGNRAPLTHGIEETTLLKILSSDERERSFLAQRARKKTRFFWECKKENSLRCIFVTVAITHFLSQRRGCFRDVQKANSTVLICVKSHLHKDGKNWDRSIKLPPPVHIPARSVKILRFATAVQQKMLHTREMYGLRSLRSLNAPWREFAVN